MPEGVVREADDRAIAEAAAFIRGGRLVAFPTETVYGLGADATNDSAVAAVFAVKDRPRFNPLIVHVLDQAAAERLGVFAAPGRALAAAFWPGPLTLVVRRQDRCPVSLLACAGLDTIALRAPAHPIAQGLLAASGRPIAAPSANRSGRVSPTTAQHVLEEMGDRVALILDDGPCTIGIESTVIDLSGPAPALLRPGAITAEQLAALVGPLAAPRAGAAPRSP
ncbi:MAG: threonylcarbamoyl-AMP synthase, partial [Alphaproteobacteria bacterium]|nr:threonylcarbamoyl-AMP synthase [Alphaproteobacteria bacterium]